MIISRVFRGITNHYPIRVTDWFLAAMLTNFGTILLAPGEIVDGGVIYQFLRSIMGEDVWGWICVVIGVSRLVALTVNGTFPAFRWSPHIRFICAVLSCLVWFQVALGVQLADETSDGLAIYRYLLLFDIYNSFLAASEAGVVERLRKDHRNAVAGR